MKKKYILTYLILKIQAEEYGYNSYLPSIRFIANKFQVTTKTVQEVFLELKKLNLIKSVARSGYVCNEDYIFNLWRIRNEYFNDHKNVFVDVIPIDLKKHLKLKGQWFIKHLNVAVKDRHWIGLIKFHFLFEQSDLNLSLKKFLTSYGKPITNVEINIKGLTNDKSIFLQNYFAFENTSFVEEKIDFYSFDELVAELYFYQPINTYSKKINFNIS